MKTKFKTTIITTCAALFSLLMITSCKKSPVKKTYKVQGYVTNLDETRPLAGIHISVEEVCGSGMLGNSTPKGSTTTDANGFYSLSFDHQESTDFMSDCKLRIEAHHNESNGTGTFTSYWQESYGELYLANKAEQTVNIKMYGFCNLKVSLETQQTPADSVFVTKDDGRLVRDKMLYPPSNNAYIFEAKADQYVQLQFDVYQGASKTTTVDSIYCKTNQGMFEYTFKY